MNIYFQGLVLGLAYVAPIGMQNLFVIQNALQGSKTQAFFTAFFIIINDIALACACFFGVGNLLIRFPQIKFPLLIGGLFVILYIAYSLWKSDTKSIINKQQLPVKISGIFLTCFVVTWFNPQAIIDGTMLFGSIRASLPVNVVGYFIAGFASASILWFSALSFFVGLTKKAFTTKTQLILNRICALILMLFCARLLFDLLL